MYAVLQTAFLGDMILTTPLLERLAQEGPVHVVATPANAALLAQHPAVASVMVFDKRGADRGWRGLRRVAQALRATGARTAFLAQGSVRTAAIAWLAGIPERVGFASSPGRWLYTRQLPFDRRLHHAQRLWQLASPPGMPEVPPVLRPSLYPGASEQTQVDTLLHEAGVSAQDRLIALAPGSVWATKRWPSYPALAAALLARLPLSEGPPPRFVVLGGRDDAPLAAAIAEAVADAVAERGDAPVVDATGRLTLLASAALLARCAVLVTNDSAPLHLASAMNTPTVALFGPTLPAFGFGPLAASQTVLERPGLPCRPCGAHGGRQCPKGHWQCMRDLTPELVAEATRSLSGTLGDPHRG